jgi:hypothetical protein
MGNKINTYGSILDQVIGTKLNKFLTPQQNQGGLLNFVKSPYGQDIASGLLAQSGYSTMPTSFGQSLGVATNQANQLRSQRRANDIAELGTMVNLRGALQDPERKIIEGKDGFQYYLDGTRVLPNVKAPDPEYKSTDFFNMINPSTGEKRQINLKNKDDLAFINSSDSDGFVKATVESTTSDLKDVNATKEKAFLETYEATDAIVRSLGEFKDQVNKDTVTTGSFAGGINRTVSNIKTELNDLRLTFVKDNKSEVSEASDIINNAEGYIDDTFGKQLEESAIDTGILKSMVIQIAYDYAKLNNKDGRISEQDFKKGVEILLAGGVKSKDAITRNANRLMGDAVKRLETSYTGFSISEGLEKGNKYQSLVDSVMGNYENALGGGFDNNTNQDTSTVGGSIVIDLDKYQ